MRYGVKREEASKTGFRYYEAFIIKKWPLNFKKFVKFNKKSRNSNTNSK